MLPNTYEDLNSYYGHVFLRILNEKTNQSDWVYVSEWEPPDIHKSNRLLHIYTPKNLSNPKLIDVPDVSHIDESIPESQYFFYNAQAILLKRVPYRGTAKALSTKNAFFFNPLMNLIPSNFVQGIYLDRWNMGDWLAILNNQKTWVNIPLNVAKQLLKQENFLSIPIKTRWCLSLSSESDYDYILWYYQTPVAYLTYNNRAFLLAPEFRQELIDNFPDVEI